MKREKKDALRRRRMFERKRLFKKGETYVIDGGHYEGEETNKVTRVETIEGWKGSSTTRPELAKGTTAGSNLLYTKQRPEMALYINKSLNQRGEQH